MKILVLIKQVPLVWAMKFDPGSRTLQREGVPSEVSSFDLRALAKAVEVQRERGGEVVAITMGPPQARAALEECLTLGATRAIHLCDRALAGSDTLATARALAAAIRRESFDLVLCGRHSVDAETGQVGPELAELLDLPQITAARGLSIDAQNNLRVERETDQGHEVVECALPALVSATEDLAPEPEASSEGREQAKSRSIVTLALADLGLTAAEVGAPGSPTWVQGFEVVASHRQGRVLTGDSLRDRIDQLVASLLEAGLYGEWKIEAARPQVHADAPRVRRRGPSDVWVVAEWFGTELRPVTLELLTKARQLARQLGSRVAAVAIGADARAFVAPLAHAGADQVLLADDPGLGHYDTERHAAVLSAAVRERSPGIVLLPSTNIGRDLAPRVAARLDLGLTGDCLDLDLDTEGRLRQMKPAFGGSIVSPILSKTLPEMATVRPGILHADNPDPSRRAEVERLTTALPQARLELLESVANAAAATELDEAEIVVGAGMGLGGPANVAVVEPLARVLGAALCTTRDAVDRGWMERQYQVGFTGRSIAPRLYLAVGIRGAVYHMVGVRRAGMVVAINKDPKAPIFKAADLGLVGDYAEVVPKLVNKLREVKAARA